MLIPTNFPLSRCYLSPILHEYVYQINKRLFLFYYSDNKDNKILNNMDYLVHTWGTLAVMAGAAILFYDIKNRNSVNAIHYVSSLTFSIIMICLGMTTIILQKYDNICAVFFGISFLNFTYRNTQSYTPSFTIQYINHLKGYFVGIGSICYGLYRLLCE